MGFDIPMNTSGAQSLSSLMGGISNVSGGSTAVNVNPQVNSVGSSANIPVSGVSAGTTSIAQSGGRQGVFLRKGQKVNLAGNGQSLSAVTVGLGWDLVNQACDLDVSAFLLGQDGRVLGDDWFVFYGQPVSPDGSVRHSGDSKGQGSGDDEQIIVNLMQLNQQCKKIVFVITINEALENGQNFSMVANAYVRVVDNGTGAELVRFNLTDYYANVTSMMVGEIYNHNGQWKFNAVGDGVAKDLADLCAMYGVNVAD